METCYSLCYGEYSRHLPTKARTRRVFGSHFEWRWCFGPTSDRFLERLNLSIVSDRQRETGQCLLFFSSPWILPCHAVILQLSCSVSDRLEMNEGLCLTELILTLTVGCKYFLVCLYCQIFSLDALIVPWMHRFTSHNLHKSFTAIFTPVFRSMVLFLLHTCIYSGCSNQLNQCITYVITKHYVIGLQVHQWF